MSYQDILSGKIKVADKHGIIVDAEQMHPSSLPTQKVIVPWALELGLIEKVPRDNPPYIKWVLSEEGETIELK